MTEKRILRIDSAELNSVGGVSNLLKVGEVRDPNKPQMVTVGNVEVDISPILAPFEQLAVGATIAAKNPMNPAAYRALQQAQQQMLSLQRAKMPAELAALYAPFMNELKKLEASIQGAVRMRMEVGHRMMSQPTIGIPLNVTLTYGATVDTSEIVVQNPYLGAGGNQTGAIWAITGIEGPSGFNTSGFILVTLLKVAGHDYVAQGLSGIKDWPSNTGRSTKRGVPLWAFSCDKVVRTETHWRPWNLGETPGIIGSIMRETGNVSFTFGWNGGSGTTFTDTLMVWVRASMCGSPFIDKTIQEVFVPIGQQARGAIKLVHQMPTILNRALAPNLNATIRGVDEIAGFGDDELMFMMPQD